MKKLIIGKGLEERIANCNFCGEEKKETIKADVPTKVYYHDIKYCFEWYREDKPWGNSKLIKEVTNDEWKHEIGYADICKDCIRQLAKLI